MATNLLLWTNRGTWQISSLWGSNQRRDHEQGVENECCCFCGTQNAQEPHRLSVVAGSLGAFNSHASNIVLDFFIAIFQDSAQNVESSEFITSQWWKPLMGKISISLSLRQLLRSLIKSHFLSSSVWLNIFIYNGNIFRLGQWEEEHSFRLNRRSCTC